MGEFDLLSAHIVRDLKNKYTHIQIILVIPYINKKFNSDLYDFSVYPPLEDTPPRFAISKRNEYMVDTCDVIISYVNKSYGGAYKMLEYGKRKKKQIISVLD